MRNRFVFLALLMLFILPGFVYADLGPKPTVDIDIYYNGNKVPDIIFNAMMLVCQKGNVGYEGIQRQIPQLNISEYDPANDCYWRPAFLAWGGDCKDSKCHFGYSPPSEFRLAVYIPSLDRVFITNEISRKNFNSNYKAELRSDGSAEISETTPFVKKDAVSLFIRALIITLIIELLVAFIYLSIARLPKKILLGVLIANLISLPIVWFIFPVMGIIWLVIVLSELFAVVFEAYFVHYINKEIITLKKSFVLSIMINITSLVVGGFVLLVMSIF